jgi:glycerophosphoryl diester phosphodiesterase
MESSHQVHKVHQAHNKKPQQPQHSIEIYGHRGSRAYAPENTLPAFDFALKAGVDYLDMDIVVTADNILVASHDLWLNPDIIMQDGEFIDDDSANTQRLLVKNITFAELQNYTVALNPNSDYAKLYPKQKFIPNTRVPSLQQVIDFADSITHMQIKYQIEVKNDPAHPEYSLPPIELAKLLYQVLFANHIIDRVEIQAFDWNILLELQRLDSRVKTAYLVSRNDIVRMYKNDITLSRLYHANFLLKDFDNSLPKMIKQLGGSCYDPEDVALTESDLDVAHGLGLKVVVWRYPEMSGNIFDPVLMKKLIAWGVDGVIVDDPFLLSDSI